MRARAERRQAAAAGGWRWRRPWPAAGGGPWTGCARAAGAAPPGRRLPPGMPAPYVAGVKNCNSNQLPRSRCEPRRSIVVIRCTSRTCCCTGIANSPFSDLKPVKSCSEGSTHHTGSNDRGQEIRPPMEQEDTLGNICSSQTQVADSRERARQRVDDIEEALLLVRQCGYGDQPHVHWRHRHQQHPAHACQRASFLATAASYTYIG